MDAENPSGGDLPPSRHMPAAEMTAFEQTVVDVLAAMSTTPFFRDDDPLMTAGRAWALAEAVWDRLDRQTAERQALLMRRRCERQAAAGCPRSLLRIMDDAEAALGQASQARPAPTDEDNPE